MIQRIATVNSQGTVETLTNISGSSTAAVGVSTAQVQQAARLANQALNTTVSSPYTTSPSSLLHNLSTHQSHLGPAAPRGPFYDLLVLRAYLIRQGVACENVFYMPPERVREFVKAFLKLETGDLLTELTYAMMDDGE